MEEKGKYKNNILLKGLPSGKTEQGKHRKELTKIRSETILIRVRSVPVD
jgi:hypothetical protein